MERPMMFIVSLLLTLIGGAILGAAAMYLHFHAVIQFMHEEVAKVIARDAAVKYANGYSDGLAKGLDLSYGGKTDDKTEVMSKVDLDKTEVIPKFTAPPSESKTEFIPKINAELDPRVR